MVDTRAEEQRIRSVYGARSGEPYRRDRPGAAYDEYRQRVCWARAFGSAGIDDPAGLEILDIGCGTGPWLRMLLEWGAEPARLHGIDLLEDRIERARAAMPAAIDLRVASAWPIPFDKASMDLAACSTVFSSILDPDARLALAGQMQRIVRPGGWMMVYDFVVSHPGNPDTVGIGKGEIRRLFRGCELRRMFRLTLAPPLRRLLTPRLLWFAHAIESFLPFLRTHRLYVLRNVD